QFAFLRTMIAGFTKPGFIRVLSLQQSLQSSAQSLVAFAPSICDGERTPMSPNPRLQRTRAAVPLQTPRGETSSLGGVRRAPLSRKPLGDLMPKDLPRTPSARFAALAVFLAAASACSQNLVTPAPLALHSESTQRFPSSGQPRMVTVVGQVIDIDDDATR